MLRIVIFLLNDFCIKSCTFDNRELNARPILSSKINSVVSSYQNYPDLQSPNIRINISCKLNCSLLKSNLIQDSCLRIFTFFYGKTCSKQKGKEDSKRRIISSTVWRHRHLSMIPLEDNRGVEHFPHGKIYKVAYILLASKLKI